MARDEPDAPTTEWEAFAHTPPNSSSDDELVEVIVRVWLVEDEESGPLYFEDQWGLPAALTPLFEELSESLGITRSLYDDIMAWHQGATAENRTGQVGPVDRQKDALEARLRGEVAERIQVGTPSH